MILETHPFDTFVPPNICCLIVGSFPGKEQTAGTPAPGQWFYGAPRNQFWKILELVYDRKLPTREEKQVLFAEKGIGITDIIRSCVRTRGTNLDENLDIRTYNTENIRQVLDTFRPRVLFTSRFVEKEFRKLFPGYGPADLLPSPSPRYFRLRIQDKAEVYKKLLPQ